jgi:hypothetical protein
MRLERTCEKQGCILEWRRHLEIRGHKLKEGAQGECGRHLEMGGRILEAGAQDKKGAYSL